ncbi:serine hydrolase [bacterium SCSIO 12696]|nr:serine hydrolase [bacterium SCSIO 12696]
MRKWLTAIITALGLSLCGSSNAITLFEEAFQDGNADGWKVIGKGTAQLTQYKGNYALRLTDKKIAITALPIKDYRDVEVRLQMAADSLEKFDKCYGEVSTDAGKNWHQVVSVGNGQDDGISLHSGSYLLKQPTDGLWIRFRAAGKGNSDFCWGDNVTVTGQPKTAVTQTLQKQLPADWLHSGSGFLQPVAMSSFAVPKTAKPAQHIFRGILSVQPTAKQSFIEGIKDTYGFLQSPNSRHRQLPSVDIQLIQHGGVLIPETRGAIVSDHPNWEWVFQPGKVWQQAGDGDYSRAALPFALQERNANCIHNGVLSFLFKSDGSVSNAAYQISSETCAYFQANLWGMLQASYQPKKIKLNQKIIADYQKSQTQRLPVKSIAELANDYPNANPKNFGSQEEINPADMTLYGFVIDGTHYVSGCNTRHGRYPYCDALVLPSYSTAKSLFAGLALMNLEHQYPGFSQLPINKYVPECDGKQWQGVTFEHALDMATGNYDTIVADVDEAAQHTIDGLFIPEHHKDKINYSCNHYQRKSAPGESWVYHTSDTYILGTAMNAALRERQGENSDIHRDILWQQLWQSLGLSPLSTSTLRTYDKNAQPFTGWGLMFSRGDIAKLASTLNAQETALPVDTSMLSAALQQNPVDRGLPARSPQFRYNNGFWGHDIAPYLNCKEPVWVPFMSGYGGIIVALFPNGSNYYYVSDGGVHRWKKAIQEAHNIQPFCQ